MKRILKVAVIALLLVVSSTTVVAAKPSDAGSTAFALEGRPIEAVICHVNDDGSGEYMMVRSKSALETHLEEHPEDYRFGTKLGACETGGSTLPGANASGVNASGTDVPSVDSAEVNTSGANGTETTVPA